MKMKTERKPAPIAWEDLNPFTQGYLEAMFFTEFHCDNPELENMGYEDLAADTITKAIEDCAGFDMLHTRELNACYQQNMTNGERYTPTQAGHDFWLTRNGHGAGFWDRGLGEPARILSDACGWKTRWPSLDVYKGDDNKVYFG